jgi:pyruvate/2-oxoglutarate dehydrogenase complex dihydrolipoamide acyltransferase (E2) component
MVYIAVIDDNEMVYRHYVDISIAVATPKGLVVPVLRNVENMTYVDIEHELRSLGERVSCPMGSTGVMTKRTKTVKFQFSL